LENDIKILLIELIEAPGNFEDVFAISSNDAQELKLTDIDVLNNDILDVIFDNSYPPPSIGNLPTFPPVRKEVHIVVISILNVLV
jgi:hypothetical protein